MKKYKINKDYSELDDKYFQLGTQRVLLRGGTIEMSDDVFKSLPKKVRDSLESLEKTKTKTKKVSKKKDTIKTEGDK